MKKAVKTIIIIIIVLALLVAVLYFGELFIKSHQNKYVNKSSNITEYRVDYVLKITHGKKNCIPVELNLYSDNTYELYTDYYECKPFQTCLLMLKYSKSIKGTYKYDLNKIINSIEEVKTGTDMNNLPEYELYTQDYSYIANNNQYLDELLKQIDVDLKQCANANYN